MNSSRLGQRGQGRQDTVEIEPGEAPLEGLNRLIERESPNAALPLEESRGSSGLGSTIEREVKEWHKDDRILRLGLLRNSPKPDAGSFLRLYDVRLIGEGAPND